MFTLLRLFIAIACGALAMLLAACAPNFPHETIRLSMIADRSPGLVRIECVDGRVTFAPIAGEPPLQIESPIVASSFGVEQLILSWNALTPPGTGLWFECRVRADNTGAWSPWLFMGECGDVAFPADHPAVSTSNGLSVDVDVLTSRTWFRDAQVRVSATRSAAAADSVPIVLHRLDVTRSLAFAEQAVQLRKNAGREPNWKPWGLADTFAHTVPFSTQATSIPDHAGRLCSPASVTMAINWANGTTSTTVEQTAAAVVDPRHGIYGNWPRNVQGAFSAGVPGKVTRFGSLRHVYETLASGGLIVASIKVRPGELPAAPYSETDGHLIVVRGYNARGDLLVSDPAGREPIAGERVYSREDMTRVWLINGRGTGYLFWKAGVESGLRE